MREKTGCNRSTGSELSFSAKPRMAIPKISGPVSVILNDRSSIQLSAKVTV